MDPDGIKPFAPGQSGLIYIGVSKDLAAREFEQHFNSESTGFSTLRRSIGAILKTDLRLTAIPRSSGNSETNVKSYRFLADGEARLTDWMCRNVEIAVCGVGSSKALEVRLITQLKPLLNLTHWPNPDRAEIMRLRRLCADEARKNRSAPKVYLGG
jgi:hypothetical protein